MGIKVPCGGFELGGGLSLDGNILQQNVETYMVCIGSEQISSSTWRYYFKENSQIQNYEQFLELYGETAFEHNILLCDGNGNIFKVGQNSDLSYVLTLYRWAFGSSSVTLVVTQYIIHTDSTIEVSEKRYNLTTT